DAPGAVYVFAHGAGADMNHVFMQNLSQHLFDVGVATLRYNFPYMDAGRGRPDPPGKLEGAVKSAIEMGKELAGGIPLLAGGKSMGGRMTSQLLAKKPDAGVKGIAFVGFPLHQPGKPSTERAAHLQQVQVPMLFLQGTRDNLANLDMMKEVAASLGNRAKLHIIDTADHGFAVLKRSGKSSEDVMSEIAQTILSFGLDS
ncbi:MAG TPA: alpha/beta family hydrolase, partial [Longimicrobiales bacterium]|nr:alpha/beta family hydrolase [Longimicrobiales bacterium]